METLNEFFYLLDNDIDKINKYVSLGAYPKLNIRLTKQCEKKAT